MISFLLQCDWERFTRKISDSNIFQLCRLNDNSALQSDTYKPARKQFLGQLSGELLQTALEQKRLQNIRRQCFHLVFQNAAITLP